MSDNPDYPDAHPTAPGGMSEKALVKELVEVHGWDPAMAGSMNWPQKIEEVVAGRQARENQRALSDYDEREDAGFEADHPDDTPDDIEAFFADIEQAQSDPAGVAALNNTALFIGMPDTRDFVFDNHAGAGPSGAERWMNCTESLGMACRFLETLTYEQQVQFAKGSGAARQGGTAHAAAEAEALLVLGQTDAAERDATLLELSIMPEEDSESYDEEMGEWISEYVDLIRTYAEDRGDDHVLIEQRVEAAIAMPDGKVLPDGEDVYVISGSGDTIVLPTKADPDLVVVDLKYGNGIDVEVDENAQARIYALGALGLLTDDEGNLITDVRTITLVIAQPRLGGIKVYTETLDDLLDWSEDVLSPALYAALTGDGAVFAPGDKTCQWCPARGACPALAEQRVEQAAELFDTIVEAEFEGGAGAFPETATLETARLGGLLSQIQGLIKIHDDLREEAQRRLLRGEQVPGFKLVGYTPPRKWTEDAVEKIDEDLGLTTKQIDDLWKHSLLTPKQALTVLKKQHGLDAPEQILGDLMDSPVQRPVIAKADDRRHEWKGAPAEQMFADETETDESGDEG